MTAPAVRYTDLLRFGLRVGDAKRLALGMANHHHPLSITEEEFAFIRAHVASRRYRSAYELATGFGVSACAIGLGLREGGGGTLLSVDSYIEERFNLATAYQNAAQQVHPDADGLRIAKQLRDHFGLGDIVRFELGWSPDDIPRLLGARSLDFVFIDGAHFDEHVRADVASIRDRLRRPYTIMLHDSADLTQGTMDMFSEWFGVEMTRPELKRSFHLGMFEVA